ncbi:hypothetical protein BKA70DRAFT_1249624 [Coprinopsis sp. MPI-PUGE-AT-0042]|nr:hypothetical protein BKA70DRAFT_1249624 [Coprinopsis sp. MPI-PUGE-AT-0042]
MQLPTLETASFFGQVFGIDPIEFILPRLQAPKLETITLREVMSEDSTNYPPLEDDMFPSLRSLYLIHAHAKPAGWDRLVDLTRSAKHLIIAPHIRNLAALVATPDAFAWTSRNFDKLWSKLESVTYNTHVDPLVANRWPAETVVRLPEGVSHRHRQNNRVLPINGSGDGVFMPEFWPPDFAWGDNSDDPFVVEEDDEWDY